ncbi:hypothetical protein TNIN_356001 [Trichonephila inaurata madagascariensis]|uniref:Uncharacterized protein n=1 Tax=Trichonephila inaurata madagascariensis TaxID=2747483 RepID=A0A8X6YJ74_9ARAC|nr:hypothetical protein TNIN_356001 [Trichonephila inaurata madagascariensis]
MASIFHNQRHITRCIAMIEHPGVGKFLLNATKPNPQKFEHFCVKFTVLFVYPCRCTLEDLEISTNSNGSRTIGMVLVACVTSSPPISLIGIPLHPFSSAERNPRTYYTNPVVCSLCVCVSRSV